MVHEQKEIESRILRIAEDVRLNQKKIEKLGLLDGKSGIALFYFYIAKYFQSQEFHDYASDLIEDVVLSIERNKILDTFGSGISGIAWAIQHLYENGFIECDLDEVLSPLDEQILVVAERKVNDRNFDFIHGVVGDLWYLMNRLDSNFKPNILSLIDKSIKVNLQKDFFPVDYAFGEPNKCNLGLAHGLPAIFILMCELDKRYPNPNFRVILEKYLNFLKKYKNKDFRYKSIYPSLAYMDKEEFVPSRLAWCYGDLGVGLSLLKIGETYSDSKLIEDAKEVLINSSKRLNNPTDRYEYILDDPTFCHGLSGVAYMLSKGFKKTKWAELNSATVYWLNQILKFKEYNDGIGGFKKFVAEENRFSNDCSILGGMSGVGLVLLSFISEDKIMWDECLMLN